MMINRMSPESAAREFMESYFPRCNGALLAGSVVRGEATRTSDLDIVIFDENQPDSFRETMIAYGWPIEVFVHNYTSYKAFFKSDVERARPSLPKMISEGIILRNSSVLQVIQLEAKELLEMGPEKWTDETIQLKRYFITDALKDLIGSTNPHESIFIANHLAFLVHEFILRVNGQWIGESKWIVRALKQFDENIAEEFVGSFDEFYQLRNKTRLIHFVDSIIEPFGGRLFAGFCLGK